MTENIKNKTKAIALNPWIFYFLAIMVFLVAFSYIYFANKAVRTLTVLEKTKQEMQSLNAKMSELETERLELENDINQEKALSLGFVEVVNPTFIVKSSKSAMLSLNK